jgi:predicted ATPase
MPFLRSIVRIPERELRGTHANMDFTQYPFTVPCLGEGFRIQFKSNVTFLVGENGTGKSTILEAIAEKCGYNVTGGNRDHEYLLDRKLSDFASATRMAWNRKSVEGFFMRAETFFNFATYHGDVGSTFMGTAANRFMSSRRQPSSRYSRIGSAVCTFWMSQGGVRRSPVGVPGDHSYLEASGHARSSSRRTRR